MASARLKKREKIACAAAPDIFPSRDGNGAVFPIFSHVLALAIFLAGTLTAQTIHLKTRDFQPQLDRSGYTGVTLQRRSSESSHYLVQFNGSVPPEIFAKLRARGITVTAYI